MLIAHRIEDKIDSSADIEDHFVVGSAENGELIISVKNPNFFIHQRFYLLPNTVKTEIDRGHIKYLNSVMYSLLPEGKFKSKGINFNLNDDGRLYFGELKIEEEIARSKYFFNSGLSKEEYFTKNIVKLINKIPVPKIKINSAIRIIPSTEHYEKIKRNHNTYEQESMEYYEKKYYKLITASLLGENVLQRKS